MVMCDCMMNVCCMSLMLDECFPAGFWEERKREAGVGMIWGISYDTVAYCRQASMTNVLQANKLDRVNICTCPDMHQPTINIAYHSSLLFSVSSLSFCSTQSKTRPLILSLVPVFHSFPLSLLFLQNMFLSIQLQRYNPRAMALFVCFSVRLFASPIRPLFLPICLPFFNSACFTD